LKKIQSLKGMPTKAPSASAIGSLRATGVPAKKQSNAMPRKTQPTVPSTLTGSLREKEIAAKQSMDNMMKQKAVRSMEQSRMNSARDFIKQKAMGGAATPQAKVNKNLIYKKPATALKPTNLPYKPTGKPLKPTKLKNM